MGNRKSVVGSNRTGALVMIFALTLCGQGSAATRNLEGVWEARRDFGPKIEGTLEVLGLEKDCRAIIAQYNIKCFNQDGRVSFELPGNQRRFDGRLKKDSSLIRGHWIQPPTVNDGAKIASPVSLRAVGKNRWCGVGVPLKDEWTLYLVVSRQPDGSLAAFIRNPDRNIGVFWKVDRLEQDGNRIKLIGKGTANLPAEKAPTPGRQDPERVYGEGVYYLFSARIKAWCGVIANRYESRTCHPGLGSRSKYGFAPPYEYRPPTAEKDGWKIGTLEEVGMVAEPLAELVRKISEPAKSVHDPYVHGFLVARHGKLVAEEYFHGFHRWKPHDTRSASKSVTATLVGAAIQNGAKLEASTRVYDLLYKGVLPKDRTRARKR
jgi:hypothetical protein